ncbi:uncharacterized protein A1O9_02238 [Exophiala aquamarina CBS 119918]|uniref:Cytochrome P450 oxidoreductase n=1 Tax=Exophiala aquamarina CBS 119918 TaxID=1182545 RepID=A0A072PLP6_9EURO|nr:uncharacterized protein A1O9_02238 [Exophiala aquamarina CBS 119918]KEF60677.1 hypothetical protein A1O9_02238 [Exophiala aquamarina CBS 119918]
MLTADGGVFLVHDVSPSPATCTSIGGITATQVLPGDISAEKGSLNLEALQKMKTKDYELQPILEAQVAIAEKRGVEVPFAEIASIAIGGIVAGTDTTGIAIPVDLWSIFSNESIQKRLHNELISVWSDEERHPSLQSLEALLYLPAWVLEYLRYASPIAPEPGFEIGEHYLPPFTRVSSSSYLVHFD